MSARPRRSPRGPIPPRAARPEKQASNRWVIRAIATVAALVVVAAIAYTIATGTLFTVHR